MKRSVALRRAWPVLLLLLVGTALPWPASPANASCVAPQLGVHGTHLTARDRPHVRPGQQLVVHGSYFVDGCNDTGGTTTGAFGCQHQQPRVIVHPLRSISLSITQRGHTWRVGTADAKGRLGTVSWSVTMPSGLRPGSAVIRADEGTPLRVVVSAKSRN